MQNNNISEFDVADSFPASLLIELQQLNKYTITAFKGQLKQREFKSLEEVERVKAADRVAMKCFDTIRQILVDSSV